MSFFGGLSSKKRAESTVLVSVNTDSVAGAYVHYTEDNQPTLLYAKRLPVKIHGDESEVQAMLRSLGVLGAALLQEGAPALMRATGSGTAEKVFVAIDAPWEKTVVRTEYFEQKESFIFSKSLVNAALEKTSEGAPPGQLLADESVIGAILNGYETRDPYGQEAHRAAVVILSSFIDEKVATSVYAALRSLYHTKNILPIAGSSIRYQAMRIAFPHERDFLIIDTMGPLTSIALVRRDLLVAITDVPNHTADTAGWLQKVSDTLADFAEHFPLPRTIFLLAHESKREALQKRLTTKMLANLWLSDNPPKIVSVLGSHITGLVRLGNEVEPNLSLVLMALFVHRSLPELG